MRGTRGDSLKKNIVLTFTKILYTIFIIGTIILLFFTYKDIDSSIAFKFAIGYVLLTFFLILYIPIVTILNSRKLKWAEIRKRIFKFIALFIFFGASHYILDYVFRRPNLDLFKAFSSSVGLAFGLSFIDVTLLKKKDN